jgi:hypothetical protein
MSDHFNDVAEKVWNFDWSTIVSLKAVGVKDRAAIQSAIQQKYGKTIDLDQNSDGIRDAVQKARGVN